MVFTFHERNILLYTPASTTRKVKGLGVVYVHMLHFISLGQDFDPSPGPVGDNAFQSGLGKGVAQQHR